MSDSVVFSPVRLLIKLLHHYVLVVLPEPLLDLLLLLLSQLEVHHLVVEVSKADALSRSSQFGLLLFFGFDLLSPDTAPVFKGRHLRLHMDVQLVALKSFLSFCHHLFMLHQYFVLFSLVFLLFSLL